MEARSSKPETRMHTGPSPLGAFALTAASVVLAFTLRAEPGDQAVFTAPIVTQPVGSNPAANQMSEEAFEEYTRRWRAEFAEWMATYSPDYGDSEWMLGPPREGRLGRPLPLARGGVAAAEIIADLDPELHTPEATLGRSDYPAEVNPMRHSGHIIVRHAVDELKYWLDALTGADIPVRKAPTETRTSIFVGANFAKPLFPDDLELLGEGECLDGYAVRTRGSSIYIFGATTKGVLNGVYAFIESNSDLIWAHSNSDLGTVYTVNPDLQVRWGDAVDKPKTVQRGWLGHYREKNGAPSAFWMWQMRSRSNFIVAPGPSPKEAEWGCWREAGGHCLGTYAPRRGKDFHPLIPNPATGKMERPEKILHYHHNLCMTHPDLPKLYAERMVETFGKDLAKSPEAPINAFRLGIEDPGPQRQYGVCREERCLLPIKLSDGRIIPYQHVTKEGLAFRSTQLYLLLEYIARALAKQFPEARLSTYAYYFGAEPPPFQVRVQPWLTPYGGGGQLVTRDFRHPIFWNTNAKWWKYAYGWSRITDLTVLRDYNGLCSNGRPFAEIVSWDVRALLPLGIKRFANETMLQVAFTQMDFWVANRIYWNPDANVELLKKYYLRRTFREGAPEMEQFFGRFRKWWYTAYDKRADFENVAWMIDRMGRHKELYGHLVRAGEMAKHPLARANIARLRKTFEHWFHYNLEDATSDAMLANAKLGRHVRYSSFMHAGTPMPVTYVTFERDAPMDSANLITAGDARSANFEGWTFQMRIRPLGEAARDKFPVPHLSVGHDPTLLPAQITEEPTDDTPKGDDSDVEGFADPRWAPLAEPKPQPDGSYLYAGRLRAADECTFNPEKFSRFRLHYPEGAWREPDAYKPEFAVYDIRLNAPDGKRYVMPTLAEQQGNKARTKYWEGGEMGDK